MCLALELTHAIFTTQALTCAAISFVGFFFAYASGTLRVRLDPESAPQLHPLRGTEAIRPRYYKRSIRPSCEAR